MASVKTRKRKHDSKMARKRAAKTAKRAKYAALKGTSKKAKRQHAKIATSGIYKHAHIMSNCGNVGCKRCYPKNKLMMVP